MSNSPSGIRYISLDPDDSPEGAAAFLKISPLYNFGPITVGPDSAIGTWGIVSYKYLGARMDSAPELIYNLVKWLDENYDAYKDSYESNVQMTFDDLIEVLQTTYMPVHPGLVKYLKEKGVWNDDYERRNQVNTALFQQYVDAYPQAMSPAGAQGIEVKANNEKWIEFWENYKLAEQIPVIQMHVSLTQDATPVMPQGYAPATTTTPAAETTAPAETTALSIPFEIISISEAHPGDDVTVVIKTTPGAQVKITFIMPNGSASAYPSDNTKVAGEDGTISWTWNINSHVPAGEASYNFTISLNGQEETTSINKTI